MPQNEIVLWFLRQMGSAAGDGWGNPNTTNIMAGMEIHHIPEQDRGWLMKQISIFMEKRRGRQDSLRNTGR